VARLRSRLIVEAVLAAIGVLCFTLLAAAFVRGGQVVAIDDDVSRWVVGNVPGGVEWVARIVSWLGSPIGTGIVGGIAVVVLWQASRRVDATFVTLAVLGITALVAVLKAIYERARRNRCRAVRRSRAASCGAGAIAAPSGRVACGSSSCGSHDRSEPGHPQCPFRQ
jgi:hypothetical protein